MAVTWNGAVEKCRQLSGELLVVESGDENNWLQRVLNRKNLNEKKWYLLNAHRYAFNVRGAAWADGRTLNTLFPSATTVDVSAPVYVENDNLANDCYEMNATGALRTTKCTTFAFRNFVCKKLVHVDESAECRETTRADLLCSQSDEPKGWKDGLCGSSGEQSCKYHFEDYKNVNWFHARDSCRQMGAELVWLEGEIEKKSFIKNVRVMCEELQIS